MILDPSSPPGEDAELPSFPTPIARVSPDLARFGHVPDIRVLKPGDLLLTERLKPNCISKLIVASQSRLYPEGSNWTHVAIYISDWQIIHCRPLKGVHLDSLLNLTLSHKLMARRLKTVLEADSPTAENMGLRISLEAALDIKNSSYDYYGAIMVGIEYLKARASFSPTRYVPTPYIHMCSTLYVKAALSVGTILLPTNMSERNLSVTPQLLSRSDKMENIPLTWAKLPRASSNLV